MMGEDIECFGLWYSGADENPWTAYARYDDGDEFYGEGRTKREALDDLVAGLR